MPVLEKRTAPRDQVRKETCGLGDKGVIGQRNKIVMSLVVSASLQVGLDNEVELTNRNQP